MFILIWFSWKKRLIDVYFWIFILYFIFNCSRHEFLSMHFITNKKAVSTFSHGIYINKKKSFLGAPLFQKVLPQFLENFRGRHFLKKGITRFFFFCPVRIPFLGIYDSTLFDKAYVMLLYSRIHNNWVTEKGEEPRAWPDWPPTTKLANRGKRVY